MNYKLSRTKSLARPPEDFEPVFGVKEDELLDFTKDAPRFSPSVSESRACTPELLESTGRLLLGIGHQRNRESTPMISDDAQYRSLGKFLEKDGGVFYEMETNGRRVNRRISNFTIRPDFWHRYITLHGEEIFLHGQIRSGGHVFVFEIAKEKIPQFFPILRVEYPTLRLDAGCGNAERLIREYLAVVIEAAGNLETRMWYGFSGWGVDRRYHHGGQDDCCSRRVLPNLNGMKRTKIFSDGFQLLNVAKRNVSLPIFLQMAAGILAKLFEESGMPLQYIMVLAGPSGSKKTSFAKVAFCLFDVEEVVNFTSTERAIELHAEACYDFAFVLDDMSSVLDKTSLQKLNRLMRQFCDDAGRKKSVDSGRAVETVRMRGAVVVTAESRIEGLQKSGILRLLQVPMARDSVDNQCLAIFQNEKALARVNGQPSVLELFISALIDFVERRYQDILAFIVTFQPPDIPIEADRYRRTYRILCTTARIILWWGEECGALSRDDVEKIYANWLPVIQELIIYNDQVGAVCDPVKLFLQALSEGITYKSITIAERKEVFLLTAEKYWGFWDGNLIYIDPVRAYDFMLKRFQNFGICASQSDIVGSLRDMKISQGYQQKGHKAKSLKSVLVNGEKLKMLCLDWLAVRKFLEEN